MLNGECKYFLNIRVQWTPFSACVNFRLQKYARVALRLLGTLHIAVDLTNKLFEAALFVDNCCILIVDPQKNACLCCHNIEHSANSVTVMFDIAKRASGTNVSFPGQLYRDLDMSSTLLVSLSSVFPCVRIRLV